MITLKEMARLTTLLTQPHRHYHNINHINDCLVELENIPDINGDEQEVLETAIWYHDAVYNPYSNCNEENSIALLPTECDHYYVIDAIAGTKHHTEDQKDLLVTTEYMLDIDLAGFGKPFEICWKHAENIRKEFHYTTDVDFLKSRIEFLDKLDSRKRIYYTEYFYNKYEVQARRNIAEEILKRRIELRRLD